jgi:hypothetical protein
MLNENLCQNDRKLLTPPPSQPPAGILDLSNARASVFPEVEEFLVMLYSFPFPFIPEVF